MSHTYPQVYVTHTKLLAWIQLIKLLFLKLQKQPKLIMGQFWGQKLDTIYLHAKILVQQEQGYCVSIATPMIDILWNGVLHLVRLNN